MDQDRSFGLAEIEYVVGLEGSLYHRVLSGWIQRLNESTIHQNRRLGSKSDTMDALRLGLTFVFDFSEVTPS